MSGLSERVRKVRAMDRIESLERRFNRLQRCEIEDMFDVELDVYGYDYAVEEYGKEYVERRIKGGKKSG